MEPEYLEKLNRQQRAAVEYGVKDGVAKPAGPLLIIAGAGTGKTHTLAYRVAHLLASGADMNRVLLLTFTRNAAKQLIRRSAAIVRDALNVDVAELPYAGTFHAVGAQLLKEFAEQVGLQPNFTIRDRSDAADMMDMVRHKLGFSASEVHFPDKNVCLAIYSYKINSCQSVERVLSTKFKGCRKWRSKLKRLFKAYRVSKREQNVLDYDDLLLYWARMLRKPEIAKQLQDRFQYVLVDEYQDTNRLQSKILLRLKPDGRGVTVVGDDAQAIYSFRAATVRNILGFPDQFSPKARIIKIEENYRSTGPILDACNGVINLSRQAYSKKLWSKRASKIKPCLITVQNEADQARYITDEILRAKEEGVPFSSQAVLMRASHHSLKLEIELGRRNIPFVKWGGIKFLEAAHIKDVLSVLRWCENPSDEIAGFRVLKLLPGVGPGIAARVLKQLKQWPGALHIDRVDAPNGAAENWPAFVKVLAALRTPEWPSEVPEIIKWYLPLMKHDNADLRAADLDQLSLIAGTYQSREKFLMEVTLEPPEATVGPRKNARPDDDDHLVLSTIHSAKGQEWSRVTILNAVNGAIPSTKATNADDVEEERRLLYVAMTRAKDILELIIPHRFLSYRDNSPIVDLFSSPTRFIPASLNRYFKRKTAGGFNGPHGGSKKLIASARSGY